MTAKKMIGTVKSKTLLAGSTWILEIDLPEVAGHVPGQFVSLKVNDEGLRRSYSIASMPGSKTIELVVNVAPMGVGSKYVLSLNVGESVEVLGYLGKFVVRDDEPATLKELLFVGTGTGVVPFKPMIEKLLTEKKYKGQVYLLWGMRRESDLFWMEEFDKLQKKYNNFHLILVLSKPSDEWQGSCGHVGDEIEKLNLKWESVETYLCGNSEMILEISKKLIEKGTQEGKIYYERYA